MLLILHLITHVADKQQLLRIVLLVLQMLDFCQLTVSIFLTLRTGSVLQHNPSENIIKISKEIHP